MKQLKMINDFNQIVLKISKDVHSNIRLISNKNKKILAIFDVVGQDKNNEIIKQEIQDLIRHIRKNFDLNDDLIDDS